MGDKTIRYVACRNLAASMFDGEAVLLNLRDGNYYGLNRVGAELWRWLYTPKTLPELEALVSAQFNVSEDTARQDVDRLVTELRARQLIEVAG